MKVLLLCRHGATVDSKGERNLPLSEPGKQEIKNLARKVGIIAQRLSLTIWSSTSERGRESTDILVSCLGDIVVRVEFFEEFWIDDNHPYQETLVKKRIKSFEGDALLVVSHAPIAEYPVSLGGEYIPLKTGECLMVRGENWVTKI